MADDIPPAPNGKVAQHWSGIVDAAHDKIAGKIDERKQAHLARVLDRFEDELAPVLAAFHADTLANAALPDEVRALVERITHPEHFTESLLIGVAVGATIYPVLGAMTAPTAQDIANEVWSHNPTVPLTTNELATAVLKGVLDQGAAATEAAKSGLDANRFAELVNIAGQAIGVQEALLLWRRSQIDDAQLLDVMRYSNLNPRFYDMVRALQYAPPGAGTVITGALKGHLTDAEAASKIAHAGTDPTEYAWLKATAGRPPGMMQMLHLWNRGAATEADVDAAVRQSDINDHYLDFVKELRKYFPPPRSIVPMLRSKSITPAQADTLLSYYGVDQEWADAFKKEAAHTTAAGAKHATVATIIAAYDEHVITRAEADTRIASMGYDASDVTLLLDLADAKQKDHAISAAITRIHGLYVTYRATHADTVTSLASLSIPAGDQTQLLAVWTHERDANAPDLTVAQWQGALHRGIITVGQFVSAMQGRGYGGLQIKILAAESYPPTHVPANIAALDPSNL